jgi:RimJ/RimL family protein N-acetyltransferase
MTPVVRATTAEDAEALQALVGAVALERRYLGATQPFTLEQTHGYLAHVQASGGVALVADVDARLVGWVDVLSGPFEGLTHYGRLGMGVAADARGQGIGRALLLEALRQGFERFTRIELEVFASNTRAHALYRRAGFVEEGRRRAARILDGVTDDILKLGLLREEWKPSR